MGHEIMVTATTSLQPGIENLKEFSNTLQELAETDKSVYVVTSDSRGSGKLVSFGESLPDQLIEVGIAEQNLVGIAAGLASTGKKVFAISPACFLTARSLEQIKNDVCYSDYPVNVIGISAGVSYGALGSTHHSIHDFAVLRAIHNINIIAPADNYETRESIKAAAALIQPVYIRFGKRKLFHLPRITPRFEIGKASIIREGNDAVFIATGETVYPAYAAAELLSNIGIECSVVSMHTIKPLDTEAIVKHCKNARACITVEEHSIHGGLGEACATVLMEQGISIPFGRVGFPDEYTVPGSHLEIFDHYGINVEMLAKKMETLIRR
jgi:transketolase